MSLPRSEIINFPRRHFLCLLQSTQLQQAVANEQLLQLAAAGLLGPLAATAAAATAVPAGVSASPGNAHMSALGMHDGDAFQPSYPFMPFSSGWRVVLCSRSRCQPASVLRYCAICGFELIT